jgi:DNA-binding NarL/FixJ family response regulator
VPAKILLADDHAIIRDGLRIMLEAQSDITVVGEAKDGLEALAQTEALLPDVVIMDIAMPEMNGIEATRMISQRAPSVRVIILSMHHTSEHVFRAMQAGAYAYILKESAGAETVKAVRAVMRGQRYFGEGINLPAGIGLSEIPHASKSPIDSLSPRERQIIQFVVEGKTSLEIANMLSLSPKSVETYRSRLMTKLGISNIPSLVKFALLHNITPTEQ